MFHSFSGQWDLVGKKNALCAHFCPSLSFFPASSPDVYIGDFLGPSATPGWRKKNPLFYENRIFFFFINLSPQCKPCHYDEWKWLVRIFFFYIGWGATLIRRVKSGHFDWAWRAGREVKKKIGAFFVVTRPSNDTWSDQQIFFFFIDWALVGAPLVPTDHLRLQLSQFNDISVWDIFNSSVCSVDIRWTSCGWLY